jgi:hypothetical protein
MQASREIAKGSSRATHYRRHVSLVERLWLGIDRVSPPFVNNLVLEGHGYIDQAVLQDAVAQASQVNPGSRVVLKGVLRGCRWQDSGITPPVTRVSGGAWDGYRHDHAPFLKRKLPDHGPTCEVLIVDGTPQRIIFRANHGAMDGRGIITWAEDVFRVLRGEAPLGADATETDTTIVSHVTTRTREVYADRCIATTGISLPAAPGSAWRRLSLKGPLGKAVGKIGCVLAQSARHYSDGLVRLMIPVDLRNHRPGLRSTANLSTALYIDVAKDATPDSIMRDIWRQLYRKHDCMRFVGINMLDMIPITLLGLGLKVVAKMNHMSGFYNVSAIISNVGHIDQGMFCGGGFQTDTTYVIPPHLDRTPVFIVLVENMGRHEITVSVPNDLGTSQRFDRLLKDISQALTSETFDGASFIPRQELVLPAPTTGMFLKDMHP